MHLCSESRHREHSHSPQSQLSLLGDGAEKSLSFAGGLYYAHNKINIPEGLGALPPPGRLYSNAVDRAPH